jgi:hypothetical protein
MRNSANITPTPALARIIGAGRPKTPPLTKQAVSNPANAAFQAPARPVASKPSKTSTGIAATRVETGQLPIGS